MSRAQNPRAFDRMQEAVSRRRNIAVPVALGAGLGLLSIALLGGSAKVPSKSTSKTKKPKTPTVPQSKGRTKVTRYLVEAEKVSGIKGYATFGLAASKRESGWNNLAHNDSEKETAASCRAYEYQRTRAIKNSPYNAPEYFCTGTAGWYGQMGAYAVGRKPFTNLNPIWAVRDPATSTAMDVATKHSIIRNFLPKLPPGHRNWLAVRRAMASLDTFYDYNEEGDTAKGVRERLTENLQQIGVDPSFMYEEPTVSGYPGHQAVWDALRGLDPTSAANA